MKSNITKNTASTLPLYFKETFYYKGLPENFQKLPEQQLFKKTIRSLQKKRDSKINTNVKLNQNH